MRHLLSACLDVSVEVIQMDPQTDADRHTDAAHAKNCCKGTTPCVWKMLCAWSGRLRNENECRRCHEANLPTSAPIQRPREITRNPSRSRDLILIASNTNAVPLNHTMHGTCKCGRATDWHYPH